MQSHFAEVRVVSDACRDASLALKHAHYFVVHVLIKTRVPFIRGSARFI